MRGLCGAPQRLNGSRWRFWHSGIRKALVPLRAACAAFSQPIPASCGQLLTQLLLCGSLAAAATALGRHWLVSSQLCPLGPSAVVMIVWGLLLFLSLSLMPPIRCLFALSVPTLGTDQGRRLLLSYSATTLAAAVVPNVLANVHAAGQVLRCVTEGSLESLLTTTQQLHAASRTLGPQGEAGSRGLTLEVQGNGSAFYLHMLTVTQQVLEDFSDLESWARTAALGTRWLAMGLFILDLLLESAWYLHRYLTDLQFDNIYVTRQLAQQLAQARATHLLTHPPSWLLQTAQPKLSQEELLSCVPRLGLLGLLMVATAVAVATDHVVFLLAQAAVDWAEKLPVVPVTLTVNYDAAYTVLGFIPFLFNRPASQSPWVSAHGSYQWELRLASRHCRLLPAQHPRPAGPLVAGALQLLAGGAELLRPFARRLRHRIAASFFSAQEARRAQRLHARLQQRHSRHRGRPLPLGAPSRPQTPPRVDTIALEAPGEAAQGPESGVAQI
ncbi:osteoclast stimulatory transmembrane protein [Thomomys bottae]